MKHNALTTNDNDASYVGPRHAWPPAEAADPYAGIVRDKYASIAPSLLRPHNSDAWFAGGGIMTVFLAPDCDLRMEFGNEAVTSCRYKYSNDPRLNGALAYARDTVGNDSCAAYYEELLRQGLHSPALRICHILSGVDGATGSDYQVLGYLLEEL